MLLALIEKFDEKRIGKLSLQKLLFLICKKQNNPIYDFTPYYYGCFSFQANKDLSLLSSFYNLVENNEKEWKLIAEESYVDQLKNEDSVIMNEILNIDEVHNPYTLISKIYKEFPYYAIRSKRYLNNNEKELVQKEREKVYSQKEKILFTLGYEGISLDAYLNKLVKNNIALLCDVRQNPISMKYGFSKKQLQIYCSNLDIKYVHIPQLGIVNKFRKNLTDRESYKKLFDSYKVGLDEQKDELEQVYKLIQKNKRVALTCFEKDHTYCHRDCLSSRLRKDYQIKVSHL
ncbi:MAG: DUF488 domain-containing protein [Candidatus Cloacimonetes bacterium]|nr:DUF488 domain-containing protein [Candidatus Cloacimonadota bacterium]